MIIAEEHPLTPDLERLFQRHTADMHVDTPPESIHMMDKGALAAPGIRFFVLRDGGEPLAMGAFKRIDATHAEIKSMHVLAEARADGFTRLSLETGVQPGFAAARALYARAGFRDCPPFEGYREDPNSVFMTKVLA